MVESKHVKQVSRAVMLPLTEYSLDTSSTFLEEGKESPISPNRLESLLTYLSVTLDQLKHPWSTLKERLFGVKPILSNFRPISLRSSTRSCRTKRSKLFRPNRSYSSRQTKEITDRNRRSNSGDLMPRGLLIFIKAISI